MTCAHCRDADRFFGRLARAELRRYRRRGPTRPTRILLDAVLGRKLPDGFTVLDIGGGVGAIQHALLEEGAARVMGVDAAAAYLDASREEAERRGFAERVRSRHGDFVELADEVEPADVVTLDRVVCCYPDMPALVGASAARAGRLYGIVLPRCEWWVRTGVALLNLFQRLRGRDFRVYVHPLPAVHAEIERRGLAPVATSTTWLWRIELFERKGEAPEPSVLRGGELPEDVA